LEAAAAAGALEKAPDGTMTITKKLDPKMLEKVRMDVGSRMRNPWSSV
jgi:hypothetical protein